MKMHTQRKRKLNLSRNHGHRELPRRANRPKTFATEEAARSWAKARGISDFELVSAKKTKYKVVPNV